MAIRFDAGLNKDIRRVVDNYQHKRRRMIKSGMTNVPPPAKVSELKANYAVRNDLERELNRLRNFKRGDVLKKVENEGGVRAVNWQFKYLKTNARNAKEYFQREYERVSKRVAKYPGERQYLDNIRAKINILDMDVDYMSQSQFRSALTSIDEFKTEPTLRKQQYRGFLNEVEWVMDKIGYSSEQKNAFFKKFNKLTPTQFLYAYDNNDIIARIYRLYHKDYDEEEAHLTDTTENAEDLMDDLMEQADDIVTDAQNNAD